MEQRHRVVVADDQTILREGVRAILGLEPDLLVVGEAADGGEAIRRTRELRPELVILDLLMPRTGGLEALREIKRIDAGIRVLVLTAHDSEDFLETVLAAGADGYVMKDSCTSELLFAVRSVLDGKRYLSPAVAAPVIDGFLSSRKGHGSHPPFDALSPREREVVKLIAEGHRTREIGECLCVSPKTVEKHRARLMAKLKIRSVAELTTYAIRKGLVA